MRLRLPAFALPCLLAARAFGAGLSDQHPPQNIVKCQAGPDDVEVSSFGDLLTYHIHGTCQMEAFHVKGVWVPAGAYDVVATWRASDGKFHEKIKGPQSMGSSEGSLQHGPWEMDLDGKCALDPFMSGADGSSCSGRQISSSNAMFKFSEKHFPVSPRVVPGVVRSALTGKTIAAIAAEHQAPKIQKPEEGKLYSDGVPLSIDAGKGSPTKTFKLEWEAWWDPDPGAIGQAKNGTWAKVGGILDEAGPLGHVPQSAFGNAHAKWRVRARASQSAKAAWCEWRTFLTPQKPPCNLAGGPYGATYHTTSTPSSMAAGQTVTVAIGLTNTGSKTWTTAIFHLSYHWMQNGVAVVFDGQRTTIELDIASCLGTTVAAKLIAPAAAGTYTLQWDMVEEGVTWFSQKGVPTGNRTVAITAPAPALPPPPKK